MGLLLGTSTTDKNVYVAARYSRKWTWGILRGKASVCCFVTVTVQAVGPSRDAELIFLSRQKLAHSLEMRHQQNKTKKEIEKTTFPAPHDNNREVVNMHNKHQLRAKGFAWLFSYCLWIINSTKAKGEWNLFYFLPPSKRRSQLSLEWKQKRSGLFSS